MDNNFLWNAIFFGIFEVSNERGKTSFGVFHWDIWTLFSVYSINFLENRKQNFLMKYMGSKSRFAKEILPIILKDRKNGQWYVEPFAGGMNVICDVDGKRIANDNNFYLIQMWMGLMSDTKYPTNIPKNLYDIARDIYNGKKQHNLTENPFTNEVHLSDDMIGWIGWMGSANGRFFDGGYSGKSVTKAGNVRDYVEEAIKNILKQIPKMTGVLFQNKDYSEMDIPDNSLIYCDIPYCDTKQYSTSKNFEHSKFWQWVRDMEKNGHTVFISEYNAPDDFECVWQKQAKSSLSANGVIGGSKDSVEKLFKLKKNS